MHPGDGPSAPSGRLILKGARLFDGEGFRDGCAVVIEDRRIAGVVREYDIAGEAVVDLGGGLLAPGFVDAQVNGGGGKLLNTSPDVATIRTIAAAHRAHGTVALLPTVITDAPRILEDAIAAVRQAVAEAVPGVLGIHIEGPFLDPARKGAHAGRFLREMTDADVAWLGSTSLATVLTTVAPNRVTPAQIRALAAAGVIVSLGHSDAGYDAATAALDAGARGFTHLYNAMSQMNGREPGMVGAALSDPRAFAGIIADGYHVHAAAFRAAFAAMGPERLMLVSDAMPPAAGGPPDFDLQGRTVKLVQGRLELSDGTLAGSALTMDAAVRHCVARLGIDLSAALRMASLTPARFLGRDHELGRIAQDYLASLVHLGDDLSVRRTWIEGQ